VAKSLIIQTKTIAMLKFQNIKAGDYLIADNDGDVIRGEVTNLMPGTHQVCIDNGVQEFWYELNQLQPILLSDDELTRLQFSKQVNADGSIKYMKGAFRMMIPRAGDFSKAELWYRDERRHINHAMDVHELQNHFYGMTKVHLNEEAF